MCKKEGGTVSNRLKCYLDLAQIRQRSVGLRVRVWSHGAAARLLYFLMLLKSIIIVKCGCWLGFEKGKSRGETQREYRVMIMQTVIRL